MTSLPEHLMPAPVGREQLPREVLEGHQRDRILSAAIEVFAKRGYQATTVDHLVASAHVGVGSFYERFENKEACFLAAYDKIVAEGREQIAAASPPEAAWPERLAAALKSLLERIEADPLAARLALLEVQTAGEEALTRHQRNLDEVAELLRAGRMHSPFEDELPRTLEFATVGGLTWFLQQRIAVGEAAGVTKLLPEVLEIVVEPYLGEEATAELAATS